MHAFPSGCGLPVGLSRFACPVTFYQQVIVTNRIWYGSFRYNYQSWFSAKRLLIPKKFNVYLNALEKECETERFICGSTSGEVWKLEARRRLFSVPMAVCCMISWSTWHFLDIRHGSHWTNWRHSFCVTLTRRNCMPNNMKILLLFSEIHGKISLSFYDNVNTRVQIRFPK